MHDSVCMYLRVKSWKFDAEASIVFLNVEKHVKDA